MLAKKSNSKDYSDIVFDTRTKAVLTTRTHGNQESIKEKISAVREVVPNRSNHEITLVLQYYDNNVNEAIAAFMEDGAASALKAWNYTGSKPAKKRNKKKSNNRQSIVTSESIELTKDAQGTNQTPLVQNDDDKCVAACENSAVSYDTYENHQNGVVDEALISEVPDDKSDDTSSIKTDASEKNKSFQTNHVSSTMNPSRYSSNQNSRQNSVSISDDSVLCKSSRGKKGLEKSIKELARHALSFQRSSNLLAEEIEKSQKRLQQSFKELHLVLDDREKQLAKELNDVKQQATDLLSARQDQAAKLKIAVDRADGMTDAELNELRIDIKHFVSERKFDEDLWRTCRFVRDHDKLIREVKAYGEIVPVKNQYTQRRQSVSSTTSSLTHSELSSNFVLSPIEKMSVPVPAENEMPLCSTVSLCSTSLNASELAELHQKLQESLRLQGLQTQSMSGTGSTNKQLSSSNRKLGASERSGFLEGDAQMNGNSSTRTSLPARDQQRGLDEDGRQAVLSNGESYPAQRGNYRRGNSRFPRNQNNRMYGRQSGNAAN